MKKITILIFAILWVGSLAAQSYHNGVWYALFDESEHTMNTQGDYETNAIFAPTTGTLTVKWRYEWIDWLGVAKKIDTDVKESSNGGSTASKIGSLAENTSNGSNTTETFTVHKNINWLKFDRNGLPTHKVILYHLDIPLAKHILLSSGTYGTTTGEYAFGEVEVGASSAAYTIQLRSFLTNGDITVTSSNPSVFRIGTPSNTSNSITYAVGANACASSNGSGDASATHLGQISNYNVQVYFAPEQAGDYEETVTITDGTSTVVITLTGTGWQDIQIVDDTFEYTAVTCQDVPYSDEYFDNLTLADTYTTTVPNDLGGITTITLTLTVNPMYAFEEELTIHANDEGQWRGQDLSTFQPGEYLLTDSLVSMHGCDSVYVLHLEVLEVLPVAEPTYSEYQAVVCRGDSVEYLGQFYRHNEDRQIVLEGQNYQGGDSIIHLLIRQLPAITITQSLTVQQDTEFVWQEQMVDCSQAGEQILTAAYASASSCDSVYVLNLVVEEKPLVDALEQLSTAHKAKKIIHNGQVFILRDDQWFNVLGGKVQRQ